MTVRNIFLMLVIFYITINCVLSKPTGDIFNRITGIAKSGAEAVHDTAHNVHEVFHPKHHHSGDRNQHSSLTSVEELSQHSRWETSQPQNPSGQGSSYPKFPGQGNFNTKPTGQGSSYPGQGSSNSGQGSSYPGQGSSNPGQQGSSYPGQATGQESSNSRYSTNQGYKSDHSNGQAGSNTGYTTKTESHFQEFTRGHSATGSNYEEQSFSSSNTIRESSGSNYLKPDGSLYPGTSSANTAKGGNANINPESELSPTNTHPKYQPPTPDTNTRNKEGVSENPNQDQGPSGRSLLAKKGCQEGEKKDHTGRCRAIS